jgi:hypothetical protein
MKQRWIDLSGRRFGRILVVERVGKNKYGAIIWRCQCDCGGDYYPVSSQLLSGSAVSCGCFQKEYIAKRNTTHGGTYERLYRILSGMKVRCYQKQDHAYPRYGGRGIKICDEWLDYPTFKKWALSNGYRDTLTIDRIDTDGNYEPSNCQWITKEENSRRGQMKETRSRVLRGTPAADLTTVGVYLGWLKEAVK